MSGRSHQQQDQMMKPADKVATFRHLFEQMKPQIDKVLPKHLDAEALIRIALTAMHRTPKLFDCSAPSILGALSAAAQLGLSFDPTLGEAYLVPYGNQATFIPGYKGLMKLARQAGAQKFDVRVVHEKDEFDYEFGMREFCRHKPSVDEEPGKMTHVYAIVKLANGEIQFDVMSKAQVDAIRARSKASGSGPWVTDYEEMCKKTMAKRVTKLVPMDTEKAQLLRRAVHLDHLAEAGESQEIDLELPAAEAPKGKLEAVAAKRLGPAPKAKTALEIDDEKAAAQRGVMGEDFDPPLPDRDPGSDDV